MGLELIDTEAAAPEVNMEVDSDLLQRLSTYPHPVLHLYDWVGCCATYGYFIQPFDLLNRQAVEQHKLHLARRPTGGGIVFHHCDYAFSFLLPASHPRFSLNTLQNYYFVNQLVIDVILAFSSQLHTSTLLQPAEDTVKNIDSRDECRHFCMAKPTIYDVMLDGRKVGGAAQRRTKAGFLHQGTIALTLPSSEFLASLLKESVVNAMQQHTYPLLGRGDVPTYILKVARNQLHKLLIERFQCL